MCVRLAQKRSHAHAHAHHCVRSKSCRPWISTYSKGSSCTRMVFYSKLLTPIVALVKLLRMSRIRWLRAGFIFVITDLYISFSSVPSLTIIDFLCRACFHIGCIYVALGQVRAFNLHVKPHILHLWTHRHEARNLFHEHMAQTLTKSRRPSLRARSRSSKGERQCMILLHSLLMKMEGVERSRQEPGTRK